MNYATYLRESGWLVSGLDWYRPDRPQDRYNLGAAVGSQMYEEAEQRREIETTLSNRQFLKDNGAFNMTTLTARQITAALHAMKLGKGPRKFDPRTLRLSKYLTAVPPPPDQAGYITEVPDFPLYLNDILGDCTIAAAGHMIEQWTRYAGNPFVPTDDDIVNAYSAITGYDGNPWTDRGAVMLDVLKYWRKHGIAGHKIAAFAAVDPTNITEIKQAVALFGNCYIGIGLPIAAQTPITGDNGNPCWSMPPTGVTGDGTPYSWGGHCVNIAGYGTDSNGNAGSEVVTWGQIFDMTWGFAGTYMDEAFAVLSTDWIAADGKAPSGFDITQLRADLAAL